MLPPLARLCAIVSVVATAAACHALPSTPPAFDVSHAVVSRAAQHLPQLSALLQPVMERRLGRSWPAVATNHTAGGVAVTMDTRLTMDLLAGGAVPGVQHGCGAAWLQRDAVAATRHPEGAVVVASADHATITLSATTTLGLTMAVGRLVRLLRVDAGRVWLPEAAVCVVHAPPPDLLLRGHMFTDWGFAFSPFPAAAKAYVQDLVVFGTNGIEFAHIDWARGDLAKLQAYSKLLQPLGVNMSVWYPLDLYTGAGGVNATTAFFSTTHLDAVFVPGGDGGEVLQPEAFVNTTGAVAALLRTYRPGAHVWLSGQEYSVSNLTRLWAAIDPPATRSWLTGVVYGPHVALSMTEFTAAVPAGYPLRQYPDLCHVISSQYEVPRLDAALAFTHGRQVINPMPRQQAAIVALRTNATYASRFIGFGAYSEGTADDVNKCVWSGLASAATAAAGLPPVTDVVQQYANVFFPASVAGDVEGVVFGLERTFTGPLAGNPSVAATLGMVSRVDPAPVASNWRFLALKFRAVYDAAVAARLAAETAVGMAVRTQLATANASTVAAVVAAAVSTLQRPVHAPSFATLAADATALATALNATIGAAVLQAQDPTLGVQRLTDAPLGDGGHLLRVLTAAQSMNATSALAAVAQLLSAQDPGPGGFYDDLSSIVPAAHPRLDPGQGAGVDPSFYFTPLQGPGSDDASMTTPRRWRAYTGLFYGYNLTLTYDAVTPGTCYVLRVAFFVDAGHGARYGCRVVANGHYVLQDYAMPPTPMTVTSLRVPKAATDSGRVVVTFDQPADVTGNGRGCCVSEVWLSRDAATGC